MDFLLGKKFKKLKNKEGGSDKGKEKDEEKIRKQLE
jgi:hypothetical protein